ncbi:MAG: hypothetical protein IJ489_09890 [Clostridia bacterium]|nr:hypothetical protein [Clostridia bacterium]
MFERNPNLQYETVSPRRITETKLMKRPLALLNHRGDAVLLGGFGEASVLIDFDEEIVGGLEVTLVCTAPVHIRIDYEEDAELAKRRDPLACSWYQLVFDEYDLEAGEHTFVSRGRRGFRFINLSAVSEEDVTLKTVTAINGTHPIRERGSFRCSDDRLNRIWDISSATAKACMQAFYEDGVKRDGLLWLGDYRIAFPAAYYLTGDAVLARKSLIMMRDSRYECGGIPACAARGGGEQHHTESGISYMPRIPGDGQNKWIILNYMCDYIIGIEEYVRLTGDDSILPEIMQSAEDAAKFLLTLIDLETPGKWYIDDYKAKRDQYGFNYTILTDCTMNPKNCFESKGVFLLEFLMSLQTLSRLAKRTENAELRTWADETAERLDTHIQTHYFDAVHGQYLDNKKQKFCDISQYPAPQAILAGKEDPIGMERMMRSVIPNLGFSIAWRIEAMFRKGFTHEAIRDISSAWGKMLDADSRTGWERLDVPEMNATHYYDALGSFCHGWMASPAYQLPKWIVGIQPEADGFRKISVSPRLDTLTFAEASVPTANGEITVRAEKNGKGYMLYLDLPADVESCEVIWSEDHTETVLGGGKYALCSEV